MAGALRQDDESGLGPFSFRNCDIPYELQAFFRTSAIRAFDKPRAVEFERYLHRHLRKREIGPAVVNLLLFWIDSADKLQMYYLHMDSQKLLMPGLDGKPEGHFPSLSNFRTSKPIVAGNGSKAYSAIADGSNSKFEDFREDPQLKIFLTDFVPADAVESVPAARAIKRLIREISKRQEEIVEGGVDVGPHSDCFLISPRGVKDLNVELASADAEKETAKAEQINSRKSPMPVRKGQ